MSEDVNYGLKVKGLKLSDPAEDGGIGTTLVSPGKVMTDTVEINPRESTDSEFTEEGASDPFFIARKKGVRSGVFDIGTMDLEVIADLCGGTVTGIGEAAYYAEHIGQPPVKYKTMEFDPMVGHKWLFPYVMISAELVGRFRAGELNVIRVNFKTMQPPKAGVSAFYLGNYPTD